MNLLQLILALLPAAASATGVYLFMRRKGASAGKEERPQAQPPEAGLLPADYEKAAIDQSLYDRCCKYMVERRPFLVENYALQDLARAMYVNKGYLSKAINRFSGKNFRQYVNYYRVMYAIELFRKNMSLRVSELSNLSGFHSETSFLESFKAVMGCPPSHWCARERKKTQYRYPKR